MKAAWILATVATLALTPAFGDYDAKQEAADKAKREAAAAEQAKRNAEAQKMKGDANIKMMRAAVGKEAEGKSDAEVKVLYDRKMGAYMEQAKKAQAAGAK